MTVADISRRAGPYTWAQGASYPFYFKVFQASDVAVYSLTNEVEALLTSGYTVTINNDQDNNPGGSVVVSIPCGTVTITSAVEFSQEARLTNRGGFYPETLNDCYDKLTILCQQLKEELGRAITVPVTSTMTRDELLKQLLETAAKANEYAEKALEIYNTVKDLAESIDAISDEIKAVSEIKDSVVSVADRIEDITITAKNETAIQVVASDLNGETAAILDMGWIDEEITDMAAPEGGYLSNIYKMKDALDTLAENIDLVKKVPTLAQNASDYAEEANSSAEESAASAAEAKATADELREHVDHLLEIEHTDYETVVKTAAGEA